MWQCKENSGILNTATYTSDIADWYWDKTRQAMDI